MTQTYKGKSLKIISGIMALFMTVVFWAGCQQTPSNDTIAATPGLEKSGFVSASGVKAEDLLPEDSMITMKFGATSEGQLQNLEQLKQNFPAEMWAAWDENFSLMLENMGGDTGISVKEDILPVFGKNAQVMFSMSSLPIDPDDVPEIVAIASLEDREQLTGVLNAQVPEAKRKTYKDWTIYNLGEQAFIAMTTDLVVFTTTEIGMQQALDNSVAEDNTSLLKNPRYQEMLAKIPSENLFYYYVDVPAYSKAIVTTMREVSKQAAEENPSAPQADINEEALQGFEDYLNAMNGEIIAATAEPKGIRLHGYMTYDKAEMEAAGFNFESMYEPAYLYKKVPGDNMIMYVEAFNLKETFNLIQKSLTASMSTYPGMDANITEMSEQIDSFLAQQGLDLEQDILSFMDKGFAMSIQSNDNVTTHFPIPSFGIFIDASSNPDGAKKTMQKVYEMVNLLIAQGKMAQPEIANMISHEAVDNDKGVYYVAKVDLQKMPEEQKQMGPAELLAMPIEAYYGVMKDNLAFFSFMYPQFDQGNYETLEKNSNFTQALNDIKGHDRSVVYFDMQALVSYLDNYMNTMVKLGGTTEVPVEFTTFKTWASPVKSFVFGGGPILNNEMSMQGFIRIEK